MRCLQLKFKALLVSPSSHNSNRLTSFSFNRFHACVVEGQFAGNAFSFLLATGGGINYDEYGHSNGFDPAHDAGCPVKEGAKGYGAQKECCGAYKSDKYQVFGWYS